MSKTKTHRIGCGGQCPIHGISEPKIGFIPNQNALFGINSSVKVAKGVKESYDTAIIYLAPYWSFDGYHNLCPSSSAGCRSTCLVTSGQLKNPAPKQSQLDKTDFWISDPNGFLSQAHREIEKLVKSKKYADQKKKFCIRMNGTSDIAWETKSYTYKGVKYRNIMEAFPQVQFYDYTKIYGRLGKTPRNYHLTFSASEINEKQWKDALNRGFQVAMVFASSPEIKGRRKAQALPKEYMGYKVIDGDDTDLTFLQPKGVIIGLRSKGKAENDTTGFVKRDFAGSNKANLNPKTNIPNIISPRGSKPTPQRTTTDIICSSKSKKISGYPVQKEIVIGGNEEMQSLKSLVPEVSVTIKRTKGSPQVVRNLQSAVDVLRQFIGKNKIETQEFFAVMYLKYNNSIIGVYNHSAGGMNSTIADVRLILAGALNLGASAIILCHNHPSGNTQPSQADINLTKKIKEASESHDIQILDHIILTKNDFNSFRELGLL